MKRQEYRVEGLSEPISHYTDAVRAGDLLFVSGIVPVDGKGALVGGRRRRRPGGGRFLDAREGARRGRRERCATSSR